MVYKCFYCQYVFEAHVLPTPCPRCDAILSLGVTADTPISDWVQALKKNGKRMTLRVTENGFVGAVSVGDSEVALASPPTDDKNPHEDDHDP
jgi:hypothetical protein